MLLLSRENIDAQKKQDKRKIFLRTPLVFSFVFDSQPCILSVIQNSLRYEDEPVFLSLSVDCLYETLLLSLTTEEEDNARSLRCQSIPLGEEEEEAESARVEKEEEEGRREWREKDLLVAREDSTYRRWWRRDTLTRRRHL